MGNCTHKVEISSSKTELNPTDFSKSRSPRDGPTTYNLSNSSSRAEWNSTNNSQYRPNRDCFTTSDVSGSSSRAGWTSTNNSEYRPTRNSFTACDVRPGIIEDVLDGHSGNTGLRANQEQPMASALPHKDEKTKSQGQSGNERKVKKTKTKTNLTENTIGPTEHSAVPDVTVSMLLFLFIFLTKWNHNERAVLKNPINTIQNQTHQDTQVLNKKKKKRKKKKSHLQHLINRSGNLPRQDVEEVGPYESDCDNLDPSEMKSIIGHQETQIHEMTLKAKRVERVCKGEVHWQHNFKEDVCPEKFLQSMNNIERFIEELKLENIKVNNAACDYQNRLSYVAGVKLRDNNPHITDLQDSKRPMKLAEQYSKIYDDEWTDAMEKLENMIPRSDSNHEKCVHHLFSLIKAVYKACKQRSECQLQGLAQHLFLLDNPSIDQVNALLPEYPTERQKIIENRKQTAIIAIEMLRRTLLEDEDGIFLTEIKGCYPPLDDRLFAFLIESSYFSKCVEICWYFVIQDPPMYLETRPLNGTTINKETHKEYTKSGTFVKYVVWPALYLHDQGVRGPLMAKGVVQPQYL